MIYSPPLLLLTTVPGLEEFVLDEILSKSGACFGGGIVKRNKGRIYIVLRDSSCIPDLFHLARTVEHARVLLCEFETLEELDECLTNVIGDFASRHMTFSVSAERVTKEIGYTSLDIASIVGRRIEKVLGLKVSLDFPDLPLFVEYEAGTYRLGLELTKYMSLRDRPYRFFVHKSALNPIIAYVMCRLARGSMLIYDPFCGSGTIPIECCLSEKNLEVLCSDISYHNIRGARDNAAAFNLLIHFFVADVLYPPLRENTVFDSIITNPPFGLREKALGGIRKVYRMLFALANKNLKKNGRLILLSSRKRMIAELAFSYGFAVRRRIEINEGGVFSAIFVLKKKN